MLIRNPPISTPDGEPEKIERYNDQERNCWDYRDKNEAQHIQHLADAEKQAAQALVEAGKLIDESPSSIKLRLYQTLSDIAAEKNSTIVFPFPEEVLYKLTDRGDSKNKK